MSDDLSRDEILSAGPDDGDWGDVISRASRARRRYQVRAAVLLTALVVVGAASAYALTHRGQPWCKVPSNDAWKRALASHVVALSRRVALQPLAVADGRSFYAVLFSKSYSGIVKVDAGTSRFQKIQRISRPSMFRAFGDANGRWFVWADMWRDVLNDPDFPIWQVWSLDSKTGRLREIASEPDASRNGDWFNSFGVRDGLMVWMRGEATSDINEQAALHVIDLSSGRDRIISRSADFSEPGLLPDHLVASSSLAVNESLMKSIVAGKVKLPSTAKARLDLTAKIKAVKPIVLDAVTGKAVGLPRSMRGLSKGKAAAIVTDGGALVYVDSRIRSRLSLWWSPSLATRPWRVFNLPREVDLNTLQLAGRYVFFRTERVYRSGASLSRGYLVDSNTRGYVKVDSDPGVVLLSRDGLLMKKPLPLKFFDPDRSARAVNDVIFLPTKSFPAIRACPSK